MLNISIELTDACNLTCKMCSQHFRNKQPHLRETEFLSFDMWKKAILSMEKIKREKQLSPFWDGESMLHPRFNEFIKFAFENNTNNKLFNYFRLNTNGVLMDKETSSTLLECASLENQNKNTFLNLHFSIDATNSDTYKVIKQGDFYNDVVNNIIYFLKKRKQMNLDFPKVTVAFIVMSENIDEGQIFLDFWSDILSKYSKKFGYGFDWPKEVIDWIYFRRLNSLDYERDERLHNELARRMKYNGELKDKRSF